MPYIFRVRILLLLAIFLFCGSALCQQAVAPTSLSHDLNSRDNTDQNQSLGDLARKIRKDPTAEVQMSAEDAKKLFNSVDKLISFSSVDTGFAQHGTVKRRLVGRDEVEKFTRAQLAKEEYAERFARAEMTMKKFGLLPRDFNLRDFLVKANGKNVAGYYDPETKSISMLNWIPLEQQAAILAHELTHALQDQNYDLKLWQKAHLGHASADSEEESASARHAVVEGQAVVVMIDYMLSPIGRTVQNTPGIIYQMEDPAVKASFDSDMLHSAPMILREAGTFPYRSGLIFEGELLASGGKQKAFAGVFARPPRNSHEVLQPRAYLEGEKLPALHLPDVRPLLTGKYDVYDSGSMGELDVRGLLKQYGDRIVADDLASAWQGGQYVAFRRTAAAEHPGTADLALLYVSRWKSAQTAERFAHLYAAAIGQRYQQAQPVDQAAESCAGAKCPVSSVQVLTEEGPVVVTRWADNTVLISESFDAATAAKLRDAVRDAVRDASEMQASIGGERYGAAKFGEDEFSMRLCAMPEFSAFQAELGAGILSEIQKGLEAR